MPTIPGVEIAVRGPAYLRALDRDGREWATNFPRTGEQDSGELLERLINLRFENLFQVAQWLEDAGYVARPRAFDPNHPESSDEKRWLPKYISPKVSGWLRRRRDVLSWLMRFDKEDFREAITCARTYRGRIVFKDQHEKFKREVGADDSLDARTLFDFLTGAGIAPNLHAWFYWGPMGRPAVAIDCDSPMEALGLSVHIYKNFSLREWTTCANCGRMFEKERSSDRYHSQACKNYAITKARRHKIKLLKQADQAWTALPRAKRKRQDRWKWLTHWTRRRSKGALEIDPGWARKELTKRKKKGGK